MEDNTRQKKRQNSGSSWIGIVIFLLVAFGSPIISFLSQLISQLSNGAVTLPTGILLPLLIFGLVILSAVISAVRAIGGMARRNETQLPTSPMPPPPSSSNRPLSPPAPPRAVPLPGRDTPTWIDTSANDIGQLPHSPQFEPIINPKVLGFGILGVVLLLGAMGLAAFFSGMIP